MPRNNKKQYKDGSAARDNQTAGRPSPTPSVPATDLTAPEALLEIVDLGLTGMNATLEEALATADPVKAMALKASYQDQLIYLADLLRPCGINPLDEGDLEMLREWVHVVKSLRQALRDANHDERTVARFVGYAADPGTIPEPKPESRYNEPAESPS